MRKFGIYLTRRGKGQHSDYNHCSCLLLILVIILIYDGNIVVSYVRNKMSCYRRNANVLKYANECKFGELQSFQSCGKLINTILSIRFQNLRAPFCVSSVKIILKMPRLLID